MQSKQPAIVTCSEIICIGAVDCTSWQHPHPLLLSVPALAKGKLVKHKRLSNHAQRCTVAVNPTIEQLLRMLSAQPACYN